MRHLGPWRESPTELLVGGSVGFLVGRKPWGMWGSLPLWQHLSSQLSLTSFICLCSFRKLRVLREPWLAFILKWKRGILTNFLVAIDEMFVSPPKFMS